LRIQQEQQLASEQAQQQQFQQAQAAQQAALQAQLAQQAALAKQAEENSLRAQVPTSTVDSARQNAMRVKANNSVRKNASLAALGTNQLRVPLSISGAAGNNAGTNQGPVKLNIGG
jgi:hypothetical protein